MRTHLVLRVENFAATTDQVVLGLGICRDSDIGTTGRFAPSEQDVDWMLWREIFSTTNGATVNAVERVEIDLKAKRKMGELNQTYGLALQNFAGASRTIDVAARVLLALA
jgi:hypothetical protein